MIVIMEGSICYSHHDDERLDKDRAHTRFVPVFGQLEFIALVTLRRYSDI